MFNKRVRERLLTPTNRRTHAISSHSCTSLFTHGPRLSRSEAAQLGFSLSNLRFYIGAVSGLRLRPSGRYAIKRWANDIKTVSSNVTPDEPPESKDPQTCREEYCFLPIIIRVAHKEQCKRCFKKKKKTRLVLNKT